MGSSKQPTAPVPDSGEAKKLKAELLTMGFQLEHIEKALSQAKVLQTDQVLELVFQIQTEEAKKLPVPKQIEQIEEFEYVPYSCEACTFLNAEKPGKSCSICGTAAPESAKVIKVNPLAAQMK